MLTITAGVRALRQRMRPPTALLDRLRWLFLVVSLVALATQLPFLVALSRATPQLRVAGVASLVWLGWWWVAGYRRGRFLVAGELVSTAALVVVGIAVTNPEYALGVVYTGVLLRALYGGRWQAALVFLEFASANLIALAFAHLPVQPLLSATTFTTIIPGLPMMVALMQTVKGSLEKHGRALAREGILREVSAALLGTRDAAAAAEISHSAAAALVAFNPGFEVMCASRSGPALESPSPEPAPSAGIRTMPLPGLLVGLMETSPGQPLTLKPADRGWEEARGGLQTQPDDLLLVPVTLEGTLTEILIVGGKAPVPPGMAGAISALGLATSMALGLLDAVQSRAAGEARFRAMVQAASDLVLAVGHDNELVYMSPSVELMLDPQVTGKVPTALWHRVDVDDQPSLDAALAAVRSRAGASHSLTLRLLDRDDSVRTFDVMLTNLLEEPAARALVMTARDITAQTALEEQLRHQALHDPLTGLANRALLRDRLEHALASRQRTRNPITLLALDLDNFKDVNDSFGHGAGDHLLVDLTARIASCLRPSDTFARLGGDEFAILMGGVTDTADGVSLADRIDAILEAPISIGRTAVTRVGTSIGIVTALDEMSPEVILRNADIALYTAKAAGKGGHCVYRPVLHDRVLERLHTETGLRRALEHGELVLQYQPILAVADGSVTSIEALVRWDDPERGRIAPDQFIPVAESTGLIAPIGRWVLREACWQMRAWRGTHPQLGALDLAVNVSGRELSATGYVREVEAALRDFQMPAAQLVLEVTESVVIGDMEVAAARLRELRQLGVRIAIDDFGTGNSSLGQLQRLPVDILKIDRAFLQALTLSPAGAAVVQSVVELGRALNLGVVAEGIETSEQAAQFGQLTRDGQVQGFLFSRPLDPADLEQAPLARMAAAAAAGLSSLTCPAALPRPAGRASKSPLLRVGS